MKQSVSSPVKLEPELENLAGLWDAESREYAARVYFRWAHQLRVSARVLRRARGEHLSPARAKKVRPAQRKPHSAKP